MWTNREVKNYRIKSSTILKVFSSGLDNDKIAQMKECQNAADFTALEFIKDVSAINTEEYKSGDAFCDFFIDLYGYDGSDKPAYVTPAANCVNYYFGLWSDINIKCYKHITWNFNPNDYVRFGGYIPQADGAIGFDEFSNNNFFSWGNNIGITVHGINENNVISSAFNSRTAYIDVVSGEEITNGAFTTANYTNGTRSAGAWSLSQTLGFILNSNISTTSGVHGYNKGDFEVTTNFPVFENFNDLSDYLKTGDRSKEIGGKGEKQVVKKQKYLHSIIYKSDTALVKGGVKFEQNDIQLFYNSNLPGYPGKRFVAGYIVEESTPYTIKLVTNPKSEFIEGWEYQNGKYNPDDPSIKDFDRFINPRWCWSESFKAANGKYYYGKNNTNIPIFATYEEVIAYFNGAIDESRSLNKGGNYPGKDPTVGTDPGVVDLNTFNLYIECSTTYLIDGIALREIDSHVLHAKSETYDQIVNALKMYGGDPMGCIIDLFILPFDASAWGTVSAVNTLTFGNYDYTLLQGSCLKYLADAENTVKTMFSFYLDGIFNDFRDYYQNIYLWLPYSGLHQLQTEKYLYHNVECRAFVNVRTGDIRYYIFTDSVLSETFEGSVKYSAPITSENAANSAMNKLQGVASIAKGAMSISDPSSLMSSGESIATGVRDLNRIEPMETTGQFNSATNIFDPLTPYIIFQQNEIEYGADITNYYGLPDNRIGAIGNNSGYVACNNVRLHSNATESEQNEILTLLNNGVII